MKIKTSITIEEDLIEHIDETSGGKSRSELIEAAVREYLERRKKEKRDLEDLSVLNKNAGRLNKEAEDVLSYQAEI
ncbi:MAG: ribbon-helix-helix protein, CopG family [Nitrospirae bacterium]|nr:MAG: ribbon-helix-helix protein, CopG family [Nitrospirota bacterium]